MGSPPPSPAAVAECYTDPSAPPEAQASQIRDGHVAPGWKIGVTVDSEMAWIEITAPDGRCTSVGAMRFAFSHVAGAEVRTHAYDMLNELREALEATPRSRR